jgi:hypothetical protein
VCCAQTNVHTPLVPRPTAPIRIESLSLPLSPRLIRCAVVYFFPSNSENSILIWKWGDATIWFSPFTKLTFFVYTGAIQIPIRRRAGIEFGCTNPVVSLDFP